MTKNLCFCTVKIRFVSLYHLETEWISFSILLINACCWLALHARYNIALSACCKHLVSGVICDISATHRLNNNGSNLEPYGTPNSDVKRVEKCASIYTKCCRKVKYFIVQYKKSSEKLNICIFCFNV